MIPVKQYHHQANPDMRGNPLTEVFPAMTPDKLATMMSSAVSLQEVEASRSLDDHIRIQQVMDNLMNYYVPLDHQVSWAWNLWSLINSGYRHRNPLKESTAHTFERLCEAMRTGSPVPASGAPSFMESPWSAVLIGTPGTGKTTTTNALLRNVGMDVFHHVRHDDLYQVFAIHVQPPRHATGKALAQVVFKALVAEAKKTGEVVPFGNGRAPDTLAELLSSIEFLATKLNLGILVLDELQHLYRGTGVMDDDAMKFLTNLVNLLKIPVLMIGTWQCLPLLGLELRLSRRSVSPASAFFRRMGNNQEWRDFLGGLFPLQYTHQPIELNEGICQLLYQHTQGIQDLAVKLFVLAQMEAIATGTEELSMTLIDDVAKRHLNIVAPAIRQLEFGSKEEDPRIWDLEPTELDKYVRTYQAKMNLAATVRRRASTAVPDTSAVEMQVAEVIVTAGMADEQMAKTLAQDAVEKAPQSSVPELAAKVLTEATRLTGPKPTKSGNAKTQANMLAKFEALDDDDLRKVWYFADRQGADVMTALANAGHLCDVLTDVPF